MGRTDLDGRESAGMHTFMSRYLEDPQAFGEYRAFCSRDAKLTGAILASAQASLELWADPDVCRFSAANTYRPAAFGRPVLVPGRLGSRRSSSSRPAVDVPSPPR